MGYKSKRASSPSGSEEGSFGSQHRPDGASKKTSKNWTEDEQLRLVDAINASGLLGIDWPKVALAVPGRTGKQCREKWKNDLRPDINKGPWTPKEEYILAHVHSRRGNQWAEIARYLFGRSENSIKNHWNATQRSKAESKSRTFLWVYAKRVLLQNNNTSEETFAEVATEYRSLKNTSDSLDDVQMTAEELEALRTGGPSTISLIASGAGVARAPLARTCVAASHASGSGGGAAAGAVRRTAPKRRTGGRRRTYVSDDDSDEDGDSEEMGEEQEEPSPPPRPRSKRARTAAAVPSAAHQQQQLQSAAGAHNEAAPAHMLVHSAQLSCEVNLIALDAQPAGPSFFACTNSGGTGYESNRSSTGGAHFGLSLAMDNIGTASGADDWTRGLQFFPLLPSLSCLHHPTTSSQSLPQQQLSGSCTPQQQPFALLDNMQQFGAPFVSAASTPLPTTRSRSASVLKSDFDRIGSGTAAVPVSTTAPAEANLSDAQDLLNPFIGSCIFEVDNSFLEAPDTSLKLNGGWLQVSPRLDFGSIGCGNPRGLSDCGTGMGGIGLSGSLLGCEGLHAPAQELSGAGEQQLRHGASDSPLAQFLGGKVSDGDGFGFLASEIGCENTPGRAGENLFASAASGLEGAVEDWDPQMCFMLEDMLGSVGPGTLKRRRPAPASLSSTPAFCGSVNPLAKLISPPVQLYLHLGKNPQPRFEVAATQEVEGDAYCRVYPSSNNLSEVAPEGTSAGHVVTGYAAPTSTAPATKNMANLMAAAAALTAPAVSGFSLNLSNHIPPAAVEPPKPSVLEPARTFSLEGFKAFDVELAKALSSLEASGQPLLGRGRAASEPGRAPATSSGVSPFGVLHSFGQVPAPAVVQTSSAPGYPPLQLQQQPPALSGHFFVLQPRSSSYGGAPPPHSFHPYPPHHYAHPFPPPHPMHMYGAHVQHPMHHFGLPPSSAHAHFANHPPAPLPASGSFPTASSRGVVAPGAVTTGCSGGGGNGLAAPMRGNHMGPPHYHQTHPHAGLQMGHAHPQSRPYMMGPPRYLPPQPSMHNHPQHAAYFAPVSGNGAPAMPITSLNLDVADDRSAPAVPAMTQGGMAPPPGMQGGVYSGMMHPPGLQFFDHHGYRNSGYPNKPEQATASVAAAGVASGSGKRLHDEAVTPLPASKKQKTNGLAVGGDLFGMEDGLTRMDVTEEECALMLGGEGAPSPFTQQLMKEYVA